MSLASSIFARLSGAAGVTALIGAGDAARAYPGVAPQGVAAPYVVWSELPGVPHVTLAEAAGSATREIQFSCVADTYKAARQLSDAIVAALDNVTLAAGEVCISCRDYDGFSEATDQFLRHIDVPIFVPRV